MINSENNLHRNLIVTFSNQRARYLKNTFSNSFDKVVSLDSLISQIFEQISFKTKINPFVATSYLFELIQSENIEYFSYVSQDGEALELILDFIVKTKRNNIDSLQQFGFNEQKQNAIVLIADRYDTFKLNNNLVDDYDMEKEVYEYFKDNELAEYDNVLIDEFEIDAIKFYKSAIQKDMVELLTKKYHKLEIDSSLQTTAKLFKLAQNPFDIVDEVKSALKLSRKLLEDDKQLTDEDICIVASSISEYAPLFRIFAPLFELKLFDSVGLPLLNFKNKKYSSSQDVKNTFQSIEAEVNKIDLLGKKLNIKIDKTSIREHLIKNTFISEDKIGIEVTEANQLVGVDKKYKHIIFVGVDMNHFPPKATNNFLYSNDQAISYFNTNSYYDSSLLQYSHLKAIAENLYITYPSYKDKREQHLSILVNDDITDTVDVSNIQQKLTQIDRQDYLDSIISPEFTRYDGLDVSGFDAKYLSASQLNSYAQCPLRYLYMYKLALKAPKEKSEGFDVAEEGSLMHKCFEGFSKGVKQNSDLTLEQMIELMREVLEEAFAETMKDSEINIYHRISKQILSRGLDGGEQKGVLCKFVEYYFEHKEEFDYFLNSEFEKEFALDNSLKPYKLKHKDDKEYFIRGYIDRFDNLDNHINIVDYKSKKADGISQDKLNQIKEFKDFQLGLYVLYAKQEYQKEVDAYLLTFKSDKNLATKFARVSTNEELIPQNRGRDTGVLYESEYEANLKGQIFNIKEKIENGEFCFDSSSEEYCRYCEMKNMCSSGLVNKQ